MLCLPVADRARPDGADVRTTGRRARMAWRQGGSGAEEGRSGGGYEGTRGGTGGPEEGAHTVSQVILKKHHRLCSALFFVVWYSMYNVGF